VQVDILTVSNLQVDILTVCKLKVDKTTQHPMHSTSVASVGILSQFGAMNFGAIPRTPTSVSMCADTKNPTKQTFFN
jgi:hypothetical protein